MSSLLNGIRRVSIARVTSDDAATPRATLKDGLVQHQWGVGLGSRMPPAILCVARARQPQTIPEFLVRWVATRRVRR